MTLTTAPVVHLEPMRRRHLRTVMRIDARVYPRPWSLSLFISELSNRDSRAYLVARVDGRVVGHGGLMFVASDAHVTTLAVDPDWQGRTIGTRLMLALATRAVARGAAALTLEVRAGNEAAQRLYRAFGFAPAGVRKNYYSDANEDALIMWAHDVGEPAYSERLERIEAGLGGETLVDPAFLSGEV